MSTSLPPDPDIEIWDDDRPDDLQAATRPLRFERQQHDAIALARLAAEQLEARRDARHVVLDFVVDYFKAIDEGDDLPREWGSVAAMVDLLTDVVGTAAPTRSRSWRRPATRRSDTAA